MYKTRNNNTKCDSYLMVNEKFIFHGQYGGDMDMMIVTKPHVMHKIRKRCNNPDGKEVVYFQVLTKILQRSYSMNELVRAL